MKKHLVVLVLFVIGLVSLGLAGKAYVKILTYSLSLRFPLDAHGEGGPRELPGLP